MPLVRFLNTQSWAGEAFCYRPGEIIDLEEVTAIAREKAGLGSVVKSRVKAAKAAQEDKPDEPSN